jgi:hypothetical protein
VRKRDLWWQREVWQQKLHRGTGREREAAAGLAAANQKWAEEENEAAGCLAAAPVARKIKRASHPVTQLSLRPPRGRRQGV